MCDNTPSPISDQIDWENHPLQARCRFIKIMCHGDKILSVIARLTQASETPVQLKLSQILI